MPPSKHANVGPSKLESFELCPCYDREDNEDRDDQGETPAERGTRLHEATEKADLTLCMNDDEKQLVQICLDSAHMLAASSGEGHQVLKEVRVEIPDPEDPESLLTWGTADWVLIYPGGKIAHGRDYKFIRTPSVSEPEQNLQIQTYAVGLFFMFPDLEEVRFDLIMPEFKKLPDPVVLRREAIPAVIARIKAIKAERMDPFKAPRVCEICTTCKHAGRCPALTQLAKVAAVKIGLPIPETFAPDAPATPAQRSLALVIAGALKQWADQVKEYQNEYGRNGGELIGFDWMTRKGNPKILNIAKAKELVGINDVDFFECCSISIVKLATAYAKVYGISEKEAREIVNQKTQEITVRGPDVAYWQASRKKSAPGAWEIAAQVRKELPSETPTA